MCKSDKRTDSLIDANELNLNFSMAQAQAIVELIDAKVAQAFEAKEAEEKAKVKAVNL